MEQGEIATLAGERVPVKSNSFPSGSQRFLARLDMKCPHLLWISAAQLLLARMRSLRVCKKWMMCMYVPVCVSQAVSEEEGEVVLAVRPSPSLVCPSSAMPFRHVPRRVCPHPPLSRSLRHHLLMLLRRVCQSSSGIKPPETPSSLPLALDRLVVTQT